MSILPPSFVFPSLGQPPLAGRGGHWRGQGWVRRDLKPVSDSAAADKFNGEGPPYPLCAICCFQWGWCLLGEVHGSGFKTLWIGLIAKVKLTWLDALWWLYKLQLTKCYHGARCQTLLSKIGGISVIAVGAIDSQQGRKLKGWTKLLNLLDVLPVLKV